MQRLTAAQKLARVVPASVPRDLRSAAILAAIARMQATLDEGDVDA